MPETTNGTISCMASRAAMPYTPKESLAALDIFTAISVAGSWHPASTTDSTKLKNGFEEVYMALDQAPITVMIEKSSARDSSGKISLANPEVGLRLTQRQHHMPEFKTIKAVIVSRDRFVEGRGVAHGKWHTSPPYRINLVILLVKEAF